MFGANYFGQSYFGQSYGVPGYIGYIAVHLFAIGRAGSY